VNLDLRFYQEFEKELSAELEKLAAELVGGRAQSFDDYRYRVGRLKGVQDALAVAQEVQARVLGIERKN